MIEFKDITKKYNGVNVVDIRNLKLINNRIYGLIGPNGAGKTTTIRMLIGLLKSSTGCITVDGSNVSNSIDVKKKIGYIPDVANLYENLTGLEHITFVANLYGVDGSDRLEKEIKELAHLFEVEDKLDESIETYSKGTKQKISILSALIHKPQILILDEPFTGLDPIVIKKFKDYLKTFVNEKYNLVIFSTHDLDVASDICSDIVVINQGQIKYNGKIEGITKSESLEDAFIQLISDKE